MRWVLPMLSFVVGCTQSSAATVPPAASTTQSPVPAGFAVAYGIELPAVERHATVLGPMTDVVMAARSERWDEVARLIDALDPEMVTPKLRYLRARAALERRSCARSLELLDGLEAALPLLEPEIAGARADCQAEVGPFEAAAQYFVERKDAASLVKAARAKFRAKKPDDALRLLGRAIRALHRAGGGDEAVEARARALRAEIAESQDNEALARADLRWLATRVPTSVHARGAGRELERLSPSARLTAKERADRALDFARRGDLDGALAELDRIEDASGSMPKAELVHTRGFAHYLSRKDYAKASELLAESSKLSAKLRVHDAFYSARALSRADRDEEAIDRYAALANQYPASGFAEQARYLSARLSYIGGDWKKAEAAYVDYEKRYGRRGRFQGAVRYQLALTRLGLEKYSEALEAFVALKRRERVWHERALLAELEAVALLGAGKKDEAVEQFREVIEDFPLSFAALVSRARLEALGVEPPRPIAPSPASGDAPKPPPEVALPPKAALLAELGLHADAERELAAVARDLQKKYAPRGHEALCRAYGKLVTAADRYRLASAVVRSDVLEQAPGPETLWAWDCLYPAAFPRLVELAERAHGVDSELTWAVMRQESIFRPDIVSPAGAVGLLQMIEPTARRVASEMKLEYSPGIRARPAYSIAMGTHYLKRLLSRFGGRVAIALAAYNAGPHAVSRWLEARESLPLDVWVATIPYEETRKYVVRVYANYARYALLDGGISAIPEIDLAIPKGLRAKKDDY